MSFKNYKKKYKTSDYIVYSCQYHVIWCSKYRRNVLINEVEKRLKALLLEKAKEINAEILKMEIMPDHVHLILDVAPDFGIHKTVSLLKGHTSNKLRKEFVSLRKRIPTLWTRNKFISTVGSVSPNQVEEYIEGQKNT